jgi:hypothetical protein
VGAKRQPKTIIIGIQPSPLSLKIASTPKTKRKDKGILYIDSFNK